MAAFAPEAKVGIFVLLAIVVFAYFSIRIGTLGIMGEEDGYTVTATFDTIAGLENRAPVLYAGVRVGEVQSIELVGGKAKVTLKLDSGVQIPADAKAAVGSQGLLGEKLLEIKGGTQDAPKIQEGDSLVGSEPVSVDQLVSSINSIGQDIKAVTDSFRDVLGTEKGKTGLQKIFDNIEELSYELKDIVASNSEDFSQIVDNMEKLSKNLDDLVTMNKDSIGASVNNFESITSELDDKLPKVLNSLADLLDSTSQVLKQNQGDVDESLDNLRVASNHLEETLRSFREISGKIEKGEGTIGKLVAEDDVHDNLNNALVSLNSTLDEAKGVLGRFSEYETFIGYTGEYLTDMDEWRNRLSLRIQPRQDKYYLVDLVDSPAGREVITDTVVETWSTVDGYERKTIHKEETTDTYLFSLQIAKRLKNLALRGGLIESKGGAGADLLLWDDRFQLSVEGWDFRRDPFHMKMDAGLKFYDYFTLHVGWDDFLDEDSDIYFGAGISFADRDLKYLLGLLPLSSAL